jgi:uncharacterized protein
MAGAGIRQTGKGMMLRLLFMAFIGWVIWRILRPAKARRVEEPSAPSVENMFACAHCGMYVSEREMLVGADGRRYCCAEHRKLGART